MKWPNKQEINIESQIRRGIKFLKQGQLPSGEIPTLRADNKNMDNAVYVKTVAITFLVLWALNHLKEFPKVLSITHKGINFLLSERENEIIWRFFGKDSDIIPDLDDTASILAVLKENNLDLDYEKYARELIKIRNEKGLFYTWFPEKGSSNNVDWVVNANILYFFHILKIRVPEVEKYLIKVAEKGLFKKGSLYYHSPYAFAYFLSKLVVKSELGFIKNKESNIIDFILENFMDLNCIDLALSAVSLLNFKFRGKELETIIGKIGNMQMADGGWPIGTIFKHRSKKIYYGSRELTSAIVLESLHLYGGKNV